MDFNQEKFDIIVQAGQSNAAGFGQGPVKNEYIPSPDVLYLNVDVNTSEGIKDGVWSLILEYGDKPFSIEVAREKDLGDNIMNGDFSLTFCEEYKKAGLLKKDRKLLVVRAGIGGTGFMKKHWTKDGIVYLKMLEMIDYALSLNPENKIVGLLWHQGEHDAFEHNEPDNFENQLTYLFNSVKERYSLPYLPIVTADFVNEWKSENINDCAPIVDKIRKVTENFSGEFVETSDLLSNNQKHGNGDTIHFCRESLHILGRRYFNAYQKILSRK